MKNYKDQRFGFLVTQENNKERLKNKYYILCKCDCGALKKIRYDMLISGRRKSCGCKKQINNDDYIQKLYERIYKKSEKNLNGCLIWKGACNKNGYGQISIRDLVNKKKKYVLLHRLIYKLNNKNFDEKNYVLHSCDVRNCIEISHLYDGSHIDNMNDMVKKNRQHKRPGELHPLAKLKNCEVEMIRNLYKNQRLSLSTLSKKFNVSLTTIHNIVKNKTWHI